MTRFWSSFVLLTLLLPLQAAALTLGDLVVQSAPGEPLRAIIPLTLQEEESLAELQVTLASPERYALQNLQRPELLEGVQIALLAKGENRARLQFFGQKPWQGEEAILLLRLKWPQGEMERRFRLAPVAHSEAEASTPLYVEVAENESLDTIAIRLSKHSNRSYMHMMVALFRANPDAFYRDNINALKSGARLRVPSNEELYRLSDAEVFATLREHEQEREARAAEQEKAQQLEQQLAQVEQENVTIEERNRELRERLARLEAQVASMSREVLEREPVAVEAPTAEPAAVEKSESPPAQQESEKSVKVEQQPAAEGLSGLTIVLLMLLVLAVVSAIWRFAPRRGGR